MTKRSLLPLCWYLMAYLPALIVGEYYYTALVLLAYALAQGSTWLGQQTPWKYIWSTGILLLSIHSGLLNLIPRTLEDFSSEDFHVSSYIGITFLIGACLLHKNTPAPA